MNLLSIAVQKGDAGISCINVLLRYGADPYHDKLLLSLVEKRQTNVALAIIHHESFIFTEDAMAVLLTALDTEQDEVVKALLEKHRTINLNTATFNNFNALEIAEKKNKSELVALLIARGAVANSIPKVLPANGFKSKARLLYDVMCHPCLFPETLGIWLLNEGELATRYQDPNLLGMALCNGREAMVRSILNDPTYQMTCITSIMKNSMLAIQTGQESLIKLMYRYIPQDCCDWFSLKTYEVLGCEKAMQMDFLRHNYVNLNWSEGIKFK